MGRRALLVIAAMLVAAFGTGMIWLYVQHADERANKGAQPIQMLRAKVDLPRGLGSEKLTDALVERVPVYSSVTGLEPLIDLNAVKGLVLQVPVSKNLLLQKGMFGVNADLSNSAITKERLGISITLGDPARVAGMLVPGSKVTIFRTVGTGTTRQTTVMLYDVRVIGANGLSGANNSEGTPKAQVTFDLTTDEAGLVVSAATDPKIQLWLGLQNSDKQPHLTGKITDGTLLPETP